MIFSIRNILITTLALVGTAFILDAVRFYVLIRKSRALVENSVPFERAINSDIKILILGDSTAVGTGSDTPLLSTAGRLGSLYPNASVRNLGKNGLRIKDLIDMLDTVDKNEHFSVILVQVGANDIIHLTDMKDIKINAEKVFARLSEQADELVVLHSGNIGNSKLFPIYFRPILSKRSFEVREIYKKLADEYNARYVDLIDSEADKLLQDNPSTYYADDFLHLNGAGYGLWFDEIKKVL